MSRFGPLVSATGLEESAKLTLQTWMHDYLGQAERDLGRTVGSMPRPRSWTKTAGDVADIHDRAIPRIVIRSPGLSDEPVSDGDELTYAAWWTIGVAGILRGRANADEALDLARDYSAATRRCFLQKPPVVATAVRWLDEDYDVLASNRERTTVGFELAFEVLIPDVVDMSSGPTNPTPPQPPDPPTDYGEWPTAETLTVTLTPDIPEE